jgi:hypothetical protein
MIKYITKEEIETPRTAGQIRSWAEGKIKGIRKTTKGHDAVLFREGLIKVLSEEVLPLGIFCEHYFNSSSQVTIQHDVGNQNYDAKIKEDKRLIKSPLKYIEITQAHEGEAAYLRMLFLKKEGYVNAHGTVTKTGTKHSEIKVEVENEAVERTLLINDELKRICDAAKRKSKKNYPPNTGLVILFDDCHIFRDSKDIEQLKKYIHENVLKCLTNFRKVFAVGWSSKTYLKFDQKI